MTRITFSLTNFFIYLFFFYSNQKLTHFYCLLFICDNKVDFDILCLLVLEGSTSVICFSIYCKQPRPKRTRGKKERKERWAMIRRLGILLCHFSKLLHNSIINQIASNYSAIKHMRSFTCYSFKRIDLCQSQTNFLMNPSIFYLLKMLSPMVIQQ